MRTNMRRFSRWFVLAATFGFAQPGAAQLWLADHVTYLQTPPLFLRAADGRVESVDGNLRWLLGRRLSLQLERVTIKQALTEITRQTGLFLAYSDDVLPPDTRISLHADGITLAGALDDVLSDTGLNVVFSTNGQATLVKQPKGAIQVGTVGTLERILLGPAHRTDGSENLVGALRQSMAALGARTIRDMQAVEMIHAPSVQTEGKSWQRRG